MRDHQVTWWNPRLAVRKTRKAAEGLCPFTQGEGKVEETTSELITAGRNNMSFGGDLGQQAAGSHRRPAMTQSGYRFMTGRIKGVK